MQFPMFFFIVLIMLFIFYIFWAKETLFFQKGWPDQRDVLVDPKPYSI